MSAGDKISRRVVCAAIRAADGELLLGIRHYSRDMHTQIEKRRDGAKFRRRLDEDQGFVDQLGSGCRARKHIEWREMLVRLSVRARAAWD